MQVLFSCSGWCWRRMVELQRWQAQAPCRVSSTQEVKPENMKVTATAVGCQTSRFRQWSETTYSESRSSNEAEGCLFSARLCMLSPISRCGSVLHPLCCYLSTNFNVRLVSYTLGRRHLHVDSDQAPRHCVTVCFCLSVSGLSASPPSSSLPLKPWTRAASGADSPPVIRWLLNTPQQKYRKYVWWATAGPAVIINCPLTDTCLFLTEPRLYLSTGKISADVHKCHHIFSQALMAAGTKLVLSHFLLHRPELRGWIGWESLFTITPVMCDACLAYRGSREGWVSPNTWHNNLVSHHIFFTI